MVSSWNDSIENIHKMEEELHIANREVHIFTLQCIHIYIGKMRALFKQTFSCYLPIYAHSSQTTLFHRSPLSRWGLPQPALFHFAQTVRCWTPSRWLPHPLSVIYKTMCISLICTLCLHSLGLYLVRRPPPLLVCQRLSQRDSVFH